MKYRTYKKDDSYSYVFGAFPVIELIESKPKIIKEVLISSKYSDTEVLVNRLETKGINYSIDDKTINRISSKGNVFVVAVFEKIMEPILPGNHIVLHSPMNMGNLGTIIRTMVGFSILDLAIISESCDIFNPAVIRASMGAFFKVRIEFFDTIDDYSHRFSDRQLYPFMLSLKKPKVLTEVVPSGKFSLIFGNEGSGLPKYYEEIGNPIFIPQSKMIDSLNLTMAAGIGMFWFMKDKLGE